MALTYPDNICKNCGADISRAMVSDPLWDGATCSEECSQELSELELPWIEFDDDGYSSEYTDEDLIPDDDRESS